MDKWVRMFSVRPLPGVSAEQFEDVMRTTVIPAVNSGSTRGGEVRSIALYRTRDDGYRWLVALRVLGLSLPGFAVDRLERAAAELARIGVVEEAHDLELAEGGRPSMGQRVDRLLVSVAATGRLMGRVPTRLLGSRIR